MQRKRTKAYSSFRLPEGAIDKLPLYRELLTEKSCTSLTQEEFFCEHQLAAEKTGQTN
ncbi:hypothetical protein BN2497_6291 [Janthinobacterium sp. CG23_2]|nr:hypothetical protein BN2497_6291 [Janthinobacterium sp. CG23_2]CUU29543.1 hypothetical protein BN3177_6291 [Janthinobacterium sp. CG23_2]